MSVKFVTSGLYNQGDLATIWKIFTLKMRKLQKGQCSHKVINNESDTVVTENIDVTQQA
jgi:hypothetical protein